MNKADFVAMSIADLLDRKQFLEEIVHIHVEELDLVMEELQTRESVAKDVGAMSEKLFHAGLTGAAVEAALKCQFPEYTKNLVKVEGTVEAEYSPLDHDRMLTIMDREGKSLMQIKKELGSSTEDIRRELFFQMDLGTVTKFGHGPGTKYKLV